jgi:putative endonuclease
MHNLRHERVALHDDQHWPRAWKVRLIHRDNPDWDDLYDRLL